MNARLPFARGLRWTAMVLALTFSVDALAQIPQRMNFFVAARFVELEALVEQEIKDDPQPPSYKLVYLCLAYANLKKYARLFDCLDRLEGNVARGDKAMNNTTETAMLGLVSAVGTIFGGLERMRGDVRPFIHLMRADAYSELRDYDKAIAAAKKAEATPQGGSGSDDRGIRIRTLTSLGLAHAFAGKTDEARGYAEELNRLSVAYPYSALADDKVNGLARIYIALGDYKKADEGLHSDSAGWFTPLLALGDALGGALTGMEGESIFTYQRLPQQYMGAKIRLETGDLATAKAAYEALLKYRQIAANGEIYWMILADLARIAATEGELAAAIDLLGKAVEIIEKQRATINTEANKIGFVGDKQAAYASLISLLLRQDRGEEAFAYVERSKSRALVDMLAGKADFAVPDAEAPAVKEMLAQLGAAELASRAQDVPADAGVAGGLRNLALVEERIRITAPELATLITVGAAPLSELQALLAAGETLIEYYHQGGELHAFILDRGRLKAIRLDGGGLDDAVRGFREAIAASDSDAWREPAQALHARLWQPLADQVTTTDVTIVAHGALHYLPFSALLAPDGSFLVDRHRVRLLPSASVLKFLKPAPGGKAGDLLALGNPDLGDPRLDLRFAENEARTVAAMFPKSSVLVRKDASKARFRQDGGLFNRLHFATHGRFQAEDPLASGLYLAAGAEDAGVLTVGELYSMKLDADLVTLSACETGLGKVSNGDDVVGLTRGFLYAGSRSIVASLWSVDDNATERLMTAFYRNLAAAGKSEALRQAQIATRREFPHPFFWAAFQLTGRAD